MSATDRVFSVPSAKNLSLSAMVETFVPTDLFWELLESDGHHVVFGTRGSGKTMLLKMMSVEHLVNFSKRDERARQALVAKKKFGIFLPLGIDWCVAYLDTPGMSAGLFVNGVNLVSCEVLLNSIETILRGQILPGDPNELERMICVELGKLWFSEFSGAPTFISLRIALVQQQGILRGIWRGPAAPTPAEEAAAGFVFRGGSLFSPVSMGIRIINICLKLPAEHCWLLCLDELENLSQDQLRHVTTVLRAAAQNLFLKITTQPYTLNDPDTNFSPEATHVDFRDYQVRRLQCDPRDSKYILLATGIFNKRVNARVTPTQAFGESSFADRAKKVDPTFDQIIRKAGKSSSDSSSERKRIPVLAIRRLKRAAEGHTRSEAYSGWETVLRVSDGNPGVFVRILNAMNVGPETTYIDPAAQHKAIVNLSSEWHQWSQALYKEGKTLHDLIDRLGRQLEARLHGKLASEVEVQEETNRFKVDLQSVDAKWAEAFRVGARHALLVSESVGSSPRYPDGLGVWRLAYFLSPQFWLLPRRGRISRLAEKDRQLSLPVPGRGDAKPSLKIEDDPDQENAESVHEIPEAL